MKIFDNSEENEKYYDKLLEFVKTQQMKPYPRKLKDLIKEVALEALLSDKAEITGYCKNDELGTAYIELTWRYDNENDYQ